tara:strand:- start:6006 stop:6749 length:744 start_codon:yes stop_codon:yes gene_type:complete
LVWIFFIYGSIFLEVKHNLIENPIIILGGFLITSEAYFQMKSFFENSCNRRVYIVEVTRNDWLKSSNIKGWVNILDKVQETVSMAISETGTEKIDFIGHSSGGIILRLFLSDQLFGGKKYNGKLITENLITLGSPHQALRATKLRKFVNEKYPGCFFNEVNYISVGGKVDIKSKNSYFITKMLARRSYESISGVSKCEGDGLVPLSSSLLEGSSKVILKDTYHGGIFGKYWYGSVLRVNNWWEKIKL